MSKVGSIESLLLIGLLIATFLGCAGAPGQAGGPEENGGPGQSSSDRGADRKERGVSQNRLPQGAGSLEEPDYEQKDGYLYFTAYTSASPTLEEARFAARESVKSTAVEGIRSKIESEIEVYDNEEIYSRLVQRSEAEVEKLDYVKEVHQKYRNDIGQTFFEVYLVARMPWPEYQWARTLRRLEKLERKTRVGRLSKRMAFLREAKEQLGKMYAVVDPEEARSNIEMLDDVRAEFSRLPNTLQPKVVQSDLYGGKRLEEGLSFRWDAEQNEEAQNDGAAAQPTEVQNSAALDERGVLDPRGEKVKVRLLSPKGEQIETHSGVVDTKGVYRMPLSRVPLSLAREGTKAELRFTSYRELSTVEVALKVRPPRVELYLNSDSRKIDEQALSGALQKELEKRNFALASKSTKSTKNKNKSDFSIRLRVRADSTETEDGFVVKKIDCLLEIHQNSGDPKTAGTESDNSKTAGTEDPGTESDTLKTVKKKMELRVVGVSEEQVEHIYPQVAAEKIVEKTVEALGEDRNEEST